jgi:hypothetical protein
VIKTLNLSLVNSISDYQYKQPTRWQKFYARLFSPETVDLTKKGGYALGGEFIQAGKTFSIQDGQFLLITIDQQEGGYDILVSCEGETLQVVPLAALRVVKDSDLTEEKKVAAANNYYYRVACYVALSRPAPARS